MASEAARPKHLSRDLAAEDLAIRFVNTMAWRLRNPAEERLDSPSSLLEWLFANGIVQRGDFKAASQTWKERPDAAQRIYAIAIRLREAIYQILVARLRDELPPERAVFVLNEVLSYPGPKLQAARVNEFVWQSQSAEGDMGDLLMPIAFSAVELVTGAKSAKVRQCQDDRGCGWLFVDESRAQNRRWCSMGDCGNRAKAHRHYERTRRG